MIQLLKQPHPFIFNRFSVLIPFVFTLLILLLFRPFEFQTFSTAQTLFWSVLFAVVVSLSIFLIVSILKTYFSSVIEENWTVGKEILLILFVLAIIMFFLTILFLLLNPQQNLWKLLQLVFIRTFLIGFLPVSFLVIFEQYHYQKIKHKEALKLNEQLLLKETKPKSMSIPKIIIMAENQKLALQLEPHQFIYTKSDGNYIEVFFLDKREIQMELVRNSLKAIESQLPDTMFFRCHKRYLVNLEHLQKVSGNARNLELHLNHISEPIPVSRQQSDALLKRIQDS
ncbi:LytTR family DNA-binding domain-containing protein [uncultured Planktosalinus sp.]|uniref:LytR/AlgR family response regulator transcription factor n=1 Tax=uncultured Planktosalinus sp. TaxID=1810935 RepID=UPI0030DC41F8